MTVLVLSLHHVTVMTGRSYYVPFFLIPVLVLINSMCRLAMTLISRFHASNIHREIKFLQRTPRNHADEPIKIEIGNHEQAIPPFDRAYSIIVYEKRFPKKKKRNKKRTIAPRSDNIGESHGRFSHLVSL